MKHGHPPSSRSTRERDAAALAAPAEATDGEEREDFIHPIARGYGESRGRLHGDGLDDWRMAEAEFARMNAARDAPPGHPGRA